MYDVSHLDVAAPKHVWKIGMDDLVGTIYKKASESPVKKNNERGLPYLPVCSATKELSGELSY